MSADPSLRAARGASEVFRQRLTPGLVGLSVHTDTVYQRVMHERTAQAAENGCSISRLRYLLCSLDFAQLIEYSHAGRWDLAERQIADAAAALKAGGADFAVICANTGYALTGLARQQVALPILDIAEPVCRAIRAAHLSSPGLLSTLKTQQSGVYEAQAGRYGLKVISPPESLADGVQRLILDELVGGHVSDEGVRIIQAAASWFARHGADCLILGCTDLTHLVERLEAAGGTELPLFDSTRLHAAAAAEAALSGQLVAEPDGRCAPA